MHRVLITGAAGGIGVFLRTRLAKPGRVLRLLDIAPPAPATDGEAVEIVTGSVTDPAALAAAFDGVDAVVHLGGHAREDTWANILSVNIDGTHNVFEAARNAGTSRVLLASSTHTSGFREVVDGELPADSSPRPDTYYGVSKAAMESLGALYHGRFGMDVICVRIGYCFEKPFDERSLGIWLSPDDAGRLFEACLTAPSPGYRIVWGVSDNTRRHLSLREAEELGYRSQDDAERFAAEIPPAETPETFVGGPFVRTPLGVPN